MAFAPVMAELFAAMGVPAVYRSPAAAVTSLFVMRPTRALRFGTTEIAIDGACFDVLRANVTPEVGGTLTVDGIDYPIDIPPIPFPQAGDRYTADPEQLRWRVLCDWGAQLLYRTATLYQPKASASAAVGATRFSLNALPAGLDRVLPGDTFGGGVYTISDEVDAAAGAIAAVPFTPALKAPIAAGAIVALSRNADTPCRGTVEWLDTSSEPAPGVKQGDARITIPAGTLPFAPDLADRLVDDGKTWTIENIARDRDGIAWTLQVKG